MILFCPNQQEIDCFNGDGKMLGKIKFDGLSDKHAFHLDHTSVTLTTADEVKIAEKIATLDLGSYSIPMQDDD